MPSDNRCMYMAHVCFYVCCSDCVGVCGNVCCVKYKKVDWTQFTEHTEFAFAQTTIPTNIHTANRIFTNIILMTDQHNIQKGKMHSNCMFLPDHIVCKRTKRNNTRRANSCDPAIKLLEDEITSDIHIHKQNLCKVSPNNSQKLSSTQHTWQSDPLTEQHRKYKDITLHSPQLRSKRQ